MNINNNNDIYTKLISSLTSEISRVVDNSKVQSNTSNTIDTSNTNEADILELNSSLSDQTGYLNYNSEGKYNRPSLLNYLNDDSNNQDSDLLSFFNSSTNNEEEVSNINNYFDTSNNKDNSITKMFNDISTSKSNYINDLISKALEKLSNK